MLPQKITQISEQALSPVHVPFILGNEFFILSQQDVRKIEDSRLFSISKLMPNGDLKTINIHDPNDWLLQILKQENLSCNQNFLQLFQFLNGRRNLSQECQPQATTQSQQHQCTPGFAFPQPMEISNAVCENRAIASIEQQLQWNKCVNTSAPFPMTYSHGTSTTEINCQQLGGNDLNCCCCCCTKCQRCESFKELCNKCTSTQGLENEANKKSSEILGAREQLKKKKLNFSFDYIT